MQGMNNSINITTRLYSSVETEIKQNITNNGPLCKQGIKNNVFLKLNRFLLSNNLEDIGLKKAAIKDFLSKIHYNLKNKFNSSSVEYKFDQTPEGSTNKIGTYLSDLNEDEDLKQDLEKLAYKPNGILSGIEFFGPSYTDEINDVLKFCDSWNEVAAIRYLDYKTLTVNLPGFKSSNITSGTVLDCSYEGHITPNNVPNGCGKLNIVYILNNFGSEKQITRYCSYYGYFDFYNKEGAYSKGIISIINNGKETILETSWIQGQPPHAVINSIISEVVNHSSKKLTDI